MVTSAMVTILSPLLLPASAAAPQTQAEPPYAARFDCTVRSTSTGEFPGNEGPYREVVTLGSWQTGVSQAIIEMHLNDGRTIRHPATLRRVRSEGSGSLALAIDSVAFVTLAREAGDAPIRYRSIYFFHHGGERETTGTCAMDQRQAIGEGAVPGWEAR